MPKEQFTLLPSTVPTQTPATLAYNDREMAFSIGARSVSWYHAAQRPGPAFAGEAAAFARDVARAVTAHVVDELIALLDPELAACITAEVAEAEAERAEVDLGLAAQAAMAAFPRLPLRLRGAALTYAAATMRARAVRW